MDIKKWVCFFGLFVVALWVTAVSLHAQNSYPDYATVYVNDYANVIGSPHEASIRTLLTEYLQTSGTEITVVTISSIHDYNTGDTTVESFATNLFNAWGVGDADRNDGVMFLIAVADRELRIEVGSGYDASVESSLQRIIERDIIPYFQRDQMSLGIYEGVRAIKAELAGEVYESLAESSNQSNVSSAPVRSVTSPTTTTASSSSNALGWIAGIGSVMMLGGGGYYLRSRRYAPRPCPKCETMMERLDGLADDEFLDEGEQEEERIGSIDYDVWLCPNCEHYEQKDYKKLFTQYKRCPQCSYRTSSTDSTVVDQPTYHSSGTRQHRQTCNHCTLDKIWTTTIPRLQRTESSSSSSSFGSSSSSRSSSSSSSFGGGRSSGGGSSGKW